MEINFTSHNINKQNFGRTRLFNLKLNQVLPDNTTRKVDAFISELGKEDMEEIVPFLGKLGKTRWGRQILHMFQAQFGAKGEIDPLKRFFIVECPEFPKGEQAKAFANIKINPGNIVLDRLNSARDCNPQDKITGAGSAILYLLATMAKQGRKNSFSLESTSDAFRFYMDMGMKFYGGDGTRNFYLSSFDFDNFISKLANKYSIKPCQ